MKSFHDYNGITDNFLIENFESNTQITKKLIFENKTHLRLNSINKLKIRIDDQSSKHTENKKIRSNSRNSFVSMIKSKNENKFVPREKSFNNKNNNKLSNINKIKSTEKIPISRISVIKLKTKPVKDDIIEHKVDNHPIKNSLNGSYYKKMNNSLIVVKDKINSNNDQNICDNNINNNYNRNANNKTPNEVVGNRLKNITIEHLKDLLDIKEDSGQKKEIIPYYEKYSSYLNPFDTYLEKTKIDNERDLNKYDLKREIAKNHIKRKKIKSLQNQNDDVANIINKGNNQIETEIEIKSNQDTKLKVLSKKSSDSLIVIMDDGVQCGSEKKNNDTENDDMNKKHLITNSKLRDEIKWDKLKQKSEDDINNFLNVNLYNTRFVDEKNEIFKLYYQNKINIDSRFKLKTPNILKSRIGNENKIKEIKKVSSAKPKIVNNIYTRSYSKDDEIFHQKYIAHLKNFNNNKEKFKQFFQIQDIDEANDLKFCQNKTRRNNYFQKEYFMQNELVEENIKILKKRVVSPLSNSIIVYKNIGYDMKKSDYENQYEMEFMKKTKSSKTLQMRQNNNDDRIKDNNIKYNIKENSDNLKNNGFNEHCNTSNGFLNIVEFNFIDKSNINKNSNHPYNSAIKSKVNDSNILRFSNNKGSDKSSDKFNFLEKVNWKNNQESKITKSPFMNKNINENKFTNKDRKNSDLYEFQYKMNSLNQNYFPNVTNSQYYIDETSNNKFKILKKQLNKNSEKVFNMLDNLKRAQYDMTDTKRKFLIDSNDNKLKRYAIRSNIRNNKSYDI